MRFQRHTLSLALAGLLASAASAQAQIGRYNRPQINPRPTVSPYLGILRGNPAVNYFGSVRPQIEMNQQMYQMQQEIQGQANMPLPVDPLLQQMMQQAASTTGTTGTVTGHSATFFNYSHYFGNRGGGSASAAGGVGGPTGFGNPGASPIRPYVAASLISNLN